MVIFRCHLRFMLHVYRVAVTTGCGMGVSFGAIHLPSLYRGPIDMIKTVEIRNFKGARQLCFSLKETLVLFGVNNAGKTTILQAIAAWSEIASLWTDEWQDAETKQLDLGRDEEENFQSVNLAKATFNTVALDNFDFLWRNRVVEEPAYIAITTDKWQIEFEVMFDENELVKARPSRTTFDQALAEFVENPIRIAFISPLANVDVPESYFDRSVIPLRIAKNQTGNILRNIVYQLSLDIEKWDALQKTMTLYFGCTFLQPSPSDYIRVFYRNLNSDVSYELACAGSGFLQILLLYSAVLFLDSPVVLIDEPDAHLHPSRQQEILPHLRRTFPGAQLIIATHSPQLLTTVRPDDILGVGCDEEGIFVGGVSLSLASYGAESGDVMAGIMGVGVRPKDNEFVKMLREYMSLVGQDEGEGSLGLALRRQLDLLSPLDPALERADMEMRRRRIMENWGGEK